MAGNPNFSTIITSAIENRSTTVSDALSNHNGLIFAMKENGGVRPFDGGTKILENLMYGDSGAGASAYSGADVLATGSSEFLTASEYAIRQYASAITFSGLEEIQNAGRSRIIDLIESKITAAESGMLNKICQDLQGDGTGSGTIGGLKAALPLANTTGVYGGIDRATATYWRQKVRSGTALTKVNILEEMLKIIMDTTRGTDRPNVALASPEHFQKLMGAMVANQRFTESVASAKYVKAGFDSIMVYNIPVVAETNTGSSVSGMPADTTYFLNTKFIKLRPYKTDKFVTWTVKPSNQDLEITRFKWAGNLTVSKLDAHGVING